MSRWTLTRIVFTWWQALMLGNATQRHMAAQYIDDSIRLLRLHMDVAVKRLNQ